MIITKMVMENFKSYAGTREIGPFHKVSKVKKGKKREKSDRWNYFFSSSSSPSPPKRKYNRLCAIHLSVCWRKTLPKEGGGNPMSSLSQLSGDALTRRRPVRFGE